MIRRILFALPLALLAAAFTLGQPEGARPTALSKHVPGDSIAFVSLDVAKAWEHSSFGVVREARGKLEFAWAVQSLLGVTPGEMDRITAFWLPAGKGSPFVLITGRKALDAKQMAKTIRQPGAKDPNSERKGDAIVAPGAEFPYILQVDARTVLLAPAAVDPSRLGEIVKESKGLLSEAIAAAGQHTLTIALDTKTIAQIPLPIGGPLLESETAYLVADLGEKNIGSAVLRLNYAEAGKTPRAATFLKTKLDELSGWAEAQEKRVNAKGQDGSGYPAPLLEWIGKTLKSAKVKADGKSVVAKTELRIEEGLTALLYAIPDSALAPRGASAAENNMKQIVLAMINYADTNGAMPSNSYDKDGKPLLSWRVHILPFIEQGNLYQRFKLDEPWDSENNKPLSSLLIKVFQVPGRPTEAGLTYYRGFIGPKNVKPEHRPWLVEGQSKGPAFPASFSDGTSNTWLVVEAAESVPYSKPDDLPYDGTLPLPKLGGANGTYVVGFADGSARTFRRGQIDEKNMRFLISLADGNVVNIPDR